MTTIESHSLVASDFNSTWYKKWARLLKQDKNHLDGHAIRANKFWQNAALVEALAERGVLGPGKQGIGFGVGQERLPALFASLGVKVMATDQDFKTKKAGHWSAQELATGAGSLNRLKICAPEVFAANVSYEPVDMKKIPPKFNGQYDFVWSNCALGHLGSLEAGLGFIEESLSCLKPGGWAVHTTELNILSNHTTVDSGSTVIFRLKDIHALLEKLTKAGYRCRNFKLDLGDAPADKRISMRPQFGNDYSKIQVMGHLATQIILIIEKPAVPVSRLQKLRSQRELSRQYHQNLKQLNRYKQTDSLIRQILDSQHLGVETIVVQPKRGTINLKIPRSSSKEVIIEYENNSAIPLFGLYSRLAKTKPIVLATTDPQDRQSKFYDNSWPGDYRNRPSHELLTRGPGGYELADYIEPGQNFAFRVTLNSHKLAKGKYTEDFAIVAENLGWVPRSTVKLEITVS